MATVQGGSLRLFRLFGIDVFLHWSWAVVALVELQTRANAYSSQIWNFGEYLALFAIVLMHEFGHALACRSVGGQANRILLWPLGGVAYVSPPQRPGAVLWSIAAGPLVNVVLVPVIWGLAAATGMHVDLRGFFSGELPDPAHFVNALFFINLVLLAFNLLPIYPLDGGQILRALLWFILGAAKSLMVAAVIGLLGAVAIFLLALYVHSGWFIVMAAFGAMQSWTGLQQARAMSRVLAMPIRQEVRCPQCGGHPPAGDLWTCACGQSFDIFAHGGTCPACGRSADVIACPHCRRPSPPYAWYPAAVSMRNAK